MRTPVPQSVQLKPCVSCRRHVSSDSPRCPFCDAPQVAALPARVIAHAGRVSRAAIFAGLAACGSTTTAPHRPPPPPPDPVVVQQFATAPPPATGKASVRGFVTIDGRPLTGVGVRAIHPSGDGEAVKTTTGPRGEYSFVDLEPGQWVLAVDYEMPRHRPQDYSPPVEERVQLELGANARYDISLSTPPSPPRDTGPCCKPYGAPPARRRVV